MGGQGAANVVTAAIGAAGPSTAATMSSISTLGNLAVKFAKSQIGVPYVRGDETPGRGFDCSGLVQWTWFKPGARIPRTTQTQWPALILVPLSALQPGDLLYNYNLDGDHQVGSSRDVRRQRSVGREHGDRGSLREHHSGLRSTVHFGARPRRSSVGVAYFTLVSIDPPKNLRSPRPGGIIRSRRGFHADVRADLVVIGGGAAGLAAARAARRRGAQVTLVSDSPLGGDCTFTGCVPSKTLLNAAHRGDAFDVAMMQVQRTVESIAADESFDVLRGEGVMALNERATFVDRDTIDVGGHTIQARRFVVATGATPFVPPIPGLDASRVLTSERLFTLSALPRRLAILGGGPIGVEMAEAFARFGSHVTIIEAANRILPREECDSSAVITEFLEQLGVTIHTTTSCTAVEHSPNHTTLSFDVRTPLECDALLVSAGRAPSSVGFGLEAIGVRTNAKGFIEVDDRLRTSVRSIFAAGDVTQTLQFTHVADETGRVAVANALSRFPYRRFHPEWIPAVTFTSLEVARVGMLESEVDHDQAHVAYLPMSEFDRARTSGETRGFVKIITVPRRLSGHRLGGTIVGATVVAPRAGEMLAEIVLAMRTGMWPARLVTTTHAYPTWGMAVQQTTAQFFGDFGGRTARTANRVE